MKRARSLVALGEKQMNELRIENWDLFISHASEDKATFVAPLAQALSAFGVNVWYDDYELKLGDSLSRSIDAGLTKSSFGLVVLSPAFIAKRWPEYELRGRGVPQGGVISPVLSNVYLNEVDKMLEKAIVTTQRGGYTQMQYARFADDLVILISSHPKQDWVVRAVEKRLREELAKLKVEINEEKTRMVNLSKGESFGFLGFEFRLVRSRKGKWRTQFAPKMKKRTALLRKLKAIFQRYVSQPVSRVIAEINPILRGWVTYFAIGHSTRCFSYIKQWVEKKIRRHLMRARGRKGFGWKRWSAKWLYAKLGIFNDYWVSWPRA
jgi:hypothetical protein